MNVTVNPEQQLFVISSGASCSTMGFEVVFEQAKELAARLLKAGREALMPSDAQIGSLEQYEQYRGLVEAYRTLNDKATWFDARTPVAVQKTLERYRISGQRIRIFLGDTATGRDWLSEHDVTGWVGRSMGPMKVPLLIGAGDEGGSAILTHCIVRIVDVFTNKEVYRHPAYHLPEMEIAEAADYDKPLGYTHCVNVEKDGELELRANFKTMYDAAHWVAFMAGKTHEL